MHTRLSFKPKLTAAQIRNNSLLCVGLDPDPVRFPSHLGDTVDALFEFNKVIIDATHDLVCAYKPQIACFAAAEAEGQLLKTILYIKKAYPHIPVILDAKRGDIGSTASMYAKEAFERYDADAVTVNPYMGFDSAGPFLRYKDRGIIFLCRTSNAGASDIQDLVVDQAPLYEKVARLISQKWNSNENCMLVVGATWPSQMARIRAIVGDMTLLVPGVGAQGGDIEQVIKAGQTGDGSGLVISSSRSIIYAGNDENFAQAARQQAIKLRDVINRFRIKT